MVEDLIFRSLWTLNISVGEAGAKVLEGNILGTILAIFEVFRRFIWNFFRVENEHLNNCGDFRVIRDISIHPLNLAELNEEEVMEPSLRKQIARKMSTALEQVSDVEPPCMTGCHVRPHPQLHGGNSHSDASLRRRTRHTAGQGEMIELQEVKEEDESEESYNTAHQHLKKDTNEANTHKENTQEVIHEEEEDEDEEGTEVGETLSHNNAL